MTCLDRFAIVNLKNVACKGDAGVFRIAHLGPALPPPAAAVTASPLRLVISESVPAVHKDAPSAAWREDMAHNPKTRRLYQCVENVIEIIEIKNKRPLRAFAHTAGSVPACGTAADRVRRRSQPACHTHLSAPRISQNKFLTL